MTRWRLYDYPASANCYKVRLALAQLEADYERVSTDIFGGDTLTDAYGEINPARETPVLEVEGEGHLPESGAILAYVAEGSALLPEDGWPRAQVLRWLLFEQTQIMWTIGGLRFRLLTGRLDADDADAAFARAVAAGAEVRQPVQDMFWGDRHGQLEDPFGHRWNLAQHLRDVPHDELVAAAARALG